MTLGIFFSYFCLIRDKIEENLCFMVLAIDIHIYCPDKLCSFSEVMFYAQSLFFSTAPCGQSWVQVFC